ncbi:MAG: hypothetical protein KDI98_08870 [Hyphomicrobiaceae bacterium]|nr:hypothetical protein [Hyphomicrobiaceae bacterium]
MSETDWKAIVETITGWWTGLNEATEKGSGRHRAARARLRRAATLNDIVMVPEALSLVHECGPDGLPDKLVNHILLLASVLAHVPVVAQQVGTFAQCAGRDDNGNLLGRDETGGQLISHLRFKALVETLHALHEAGSGDDDAFDTALAALRRAVKHAGSAGYDRSRFINDILHFSPATKRRWHFDYWQTFKAPPATAADGKAGDTPQGNRDAATAV